MDRNRDFVIDKTTINSQCQITRIEQHQCGDPGLSEDLLKYCVLLLICVLCISFNLCIMCIIRYSEYRILILFSTNMYSVFKLSAIKSTELICDIL